MRIGKTEIRNHGVPYIIAELGSNHNGDMDLARDLILEAKAAGCDCVKFQSWTTDTIFSARVYEENYFLGDDYRKRSDYNLKEIVEAYSISENQLGDMKKFCEDIGIDFGCTPFSNREVDFLVHDLNISFIKVASMDLNNLRFLEYIALKRLPVVLSTGLGTLAEIDNAVRVIEATGNRDLILLHCVSVYPPRDETVNLLNIDMLQRAFPDYPVGFSDHTLGTAVPLAAVARGACMIEKHFTLDKNLPGWDHKVSATPEEMKELVAGAEKIVTAMGSYRRVLSDDDHKKIPAFRRSVVAARPLSKGQLIRAEDLDVKRPGTGLPPEALTWIEGRVATRDIAYDEMIRPGDIGPPEPKIG